MESSQDSPGVRSPVVLAVDPGTQKCGMAVCDATGVLARRIVTPAEIPAVAAEWVARYGVTHLVVGDRTGSQDVSRRLAEAGLRLPLHVVSEAGTTLRARARYFRDRPPRGWRRWVPEGLRMPPAPYDDYVAVLLAEGFLAAMTSPDARRQP